MAKTVHFFSFIIIIKFPGKSPEQHALVEIFRAVHASEQHLPGERSPSPVVNAPLIWRPEQVGFRDTVCFPQKDGGVPVYQHDNDDKALRDVELPQGIADFLDGSRRHEKVGREHTEGSFQH